MDFSFEQGDSGEMDPVLYHMMHTQPYVANNVPQLPSDNINNGSNHFPSYRFNGGSRGVNNSSTYSWHGHGEGESTGWNGPATDENLDGIPLHSEFAVSQMPIGNQNLHSSVNQAQQMDTSVPRFLGPGGQFDLAANPDDLLQNLESCAAATALSENYAPVEQLPSCEGPVPQAFQPLDPKSLHCQYNPCDPDPSGQFNGQHLEIPSGPQTSQLNHPSQFQWQFPELPTNFGQQACSFASQQHHQQNYAPSISRQPRKSQQPQADYSNERCGQEMSPQANFQRPTQLQGHIQNVPPQLSFQPQNFQDSTTEPQGLQPQPSQLPDSHSTYLPIEPLFRRPQQLGQWCSCDLHRWNWRKSQVDRGKTHEYMKRISHVGRIMEGAGDETYPCDYCKSNRLRCLVYRPEFGNRYRGSCARCRKHEKKCSHEDLNGDDRRSKMVTVAQGELNLAMWDLKQANNTLDGK